MLSHSASDEKGDLARDRQAFSHFGLGKKTDRW